MNYQVAVVQLQGTKEAQEDTWRAYSTEGADFSQHLVNGQTIRFPERGGLVLVADGIGGAVGGRIASDLVAGTFCETFRSSFGQRQDQGVSALQNALAAANEALQQKKR
ncbi:MAG TPA: hypothetical protein VE986_07165, partial [Hyphomicrobiales bacterium]|nr:hypothetical protein [Hyphomicrobiales bacterium]